MAWNKKNAGIMLAGMVLVILVALRLFQPGYERQLSFDEYRVEHGFAYLVGDKAGWPFKQIILEDGHPLLEAHNRDEVRIIGDGRYVWRRKHGLYFAPSGNIDPRDSGRTYTVRTFIFIRMSYIAAAIFLLMMSLTARWWLPWLQRMVSRVSLVLNQQKKIELCQAPIWKRNLLVSAILICFCFLYQSLVLLQIRTSGFLSVPVKWDDCVYLLRCIYTVDDIMNGLGLYNVFMKFNVHAPLGDFFTLISLVLSDLSITAPYYVNFIFPALLLAFCNHYLKDLSFFNKIPLFILIICTPFLFEQQITSIKYDLKGTILFSIFLLVLFNKTALRDKKYMLLVLVVLTWSTKITNLSFIVVVGYSFFIYYVGAYFVGDSTRSELYKNFKSSLQIILFSTLIVIIIMYPSRIAMIAYIRQALGPAWVDNYSLLERFLHYIPLPNGWFFGYGFGPYLVAIVVLSIIVLCKQRKEFCYFCILLSVCFVAILPVVVVKTVNPSFAYMFYGSLTAIVVYGYRVIFFFVPSAFRGVLGCALLLIWAFTPVTIGRSHPLPLKYRNELNEMVDSTVIELCRDAKSNLLLTYTSAEIPSPNYAIRTYYKCKKRLWYAEIRFESDDEFAYKINKFDYILVAEKSPEHLQQRFPANKKQEYYFSVLSNSDNHASLQAFSVKNDTYHLFRTKNLH